MKRTEHERTTLWISAVEDKLPRIKLWGPFITVDTSNMVPGSKALHQTVDGWLTLMNRTIEVGSIRLELYDNVTETELLF